LGREREAVIGGGGLLLAGMGSVDPANLMKRYLPLSS